MCDVMKLSLKDVCKEKETLQNYLRVKGEGRQHFKCYSSLERIESIVTEKRLILSRGNDWNDLEDSKRFNPDGAAKVNFGMCFSSAEHENVAMWMLYAKGGRNGAMIDIPKRIMNKIRTVKEVTLLHISDNGDITPLESFGISSNVSAECSMMITDIIYTSHDDNSNLIKIKRHNEPCLLVKPECIAGLNIKSYPWRYENETRLIVSIDSQKIPAEATHAEISFDSVIDKNDESDLKACIYLAPNSRSSKPYKRSVLTHEIDWDLCANCDRSKIDVIRDDASIR